MISYSYLPEGNDSLPAISISSDGEDSSCICISDAIGHLCVLPFIFIVGSDPTNCLPYWSQLWYVQLVALCNSNTTFFLIIIPFKSI